MPLARYKDLCMDAGDGMALGAFWASVLGLELHHRDDGTAFLTGPTDAHRIWMNQVPELKTVKHRVHLDVHAASIRDLRAFGGEVIDSDSFRWATMRDPEGGEFCAFTRDDPPDYRLYEIGIDAVDHLAQARWWAALLGGTVGESDDPDHTYACLSEIPGAPFEAICFAPVPEPKTAKNRIHLDVTTDALDPILDLGATLLRRRDDEIAWHVCADPEGNEFCVFTP